MNKNTSWGLLILVLPFVFLLIRGHLYRKSQESQRKKSNSHVFDYGNTVGGSKKKHRKKLKKQ